MQDFVSDELKRQFQSEAVSAVSECLGIDVSTLDIAERGLIRTHLDGWETFYFDGVELLMIGPIEMQFQSRDGRLTASATREFKKAYSVKSGKSRSIQLAKIALG